MQQTDRRYAATLVVVLAWMAMLFGHVVLKSHLKVGTHSLVFSTWYWFCMALGGFFLSVYRPGKSLSEIPELRTSAVAFAFFSVANSIAYLVVARRSVDSVDLFYFLCESRDMLWGIFPRNQTASLHFPGVYRFWGLVLSLFGESYDAVQWAAAMLLAVNAILVSTIVIRITRQKPMALLSGVLYLVLSLRYEGLTGSREPLCTIPYLAGSWAWLELGEHRQRFNLAATALGLGLGLALYFKQQAGLLSLGAIWFLIRRDWQPGSSAVRQSVTGLLFAATAATGIFLGLILAEGSGFTPLIKGLQWASDYKHEGSWTANVLIQIRNDESFIMMSMFAVACSIGSLFGSKYLEQRYHNFCWQLLIAAAVTMIQYRVRGYLHYTLLAIPGIVIVFSAQLAAVWRSLSGGSLWQIQAQAALIMVLVVPLLYNGQRPIMLDITDINWKDRTRSMPIPWHEEAETIKEIKALKSIIPARSEIEIVPSGRNAVYFPLKRNGTKNPGIHQRRIGD